jgi:hypothetical protein
MSIPLVLFWSSRKRQCNGDTRPTSRSLPRRRAVLRAAGDTIKSDSRPSLQFARAATSKDWRRQWSLFYPDRTSVPLQVFDVGPRSQGTCPATTQFQSIPAGVRSISTDRNIWLRRNLRHELDETVCAFQDHLLEHAQRSRFGGTVKDICPDSGAALGSTPPAERDPSNPSRNKQG